MTENGQARVSIVVPVLNEAAIIESCLKRLGSDFPDCELIVSDGGSTDATRALASRLATVVDAPPGRARQMNAGAARAGGDVVWFIHADTVIESSALEMVRSALADPAVVAGGLRIRFDRRSLGLDYLAWSSNLRARRLNWIFGDQAMFVRRSVFTELGGFPDLAILEDLEMSRRLHRKGRLTMIPASSTASSRRFVDHGTWRMIVFMQYLKALYFAGVDPAAIAERYARGPRLVPGPRRVRRAALASSPTREEMTN